MPKLNGHTRKEGVPGSYCANLYTCASPNVAVSREGPVIEAGSHIKGAAAAPWTCMCKSCMCGTVTRAKLERQVALQHHCVALQSKFMFRCWGACHPKT